MLHTTRVKQKGRRPKPTAPYRHKTKEKEEEQSGAEALAR
jgi:hypothetical protein